MAVRGSGSGSARFLLLGVPFHRAGLPYGLGGLRFATLLGRFFFLAVQFIYTFALHRLDQQFAERPDQGINAVRRIPRCDRSMSEVKFVIWSSSCGKVPM